MSRQIALGDFNYFSASKLAGRRVIANPPYKEGQAGNAWIPIAEKLLQADLAAISLIVPVAIASSKRTNEIRRLLFAGFENIVALHHEIRPRPLFKGVDQRISIVSALRAPGAERRYTTTGFLRHKAGERLSVWQAPMAELPYADCAGKFPKVAPEDVLFFKEFVPGGSRTSLASIPAAPDELEKVWIRTTGRYHLQAQAKEPLELTSKWKEFFISRQLAGRLIDSFKNGDLLRWWQIFGDGRDISITALRHEYGLRP